MRRTCSGLRRAGGGGMNSLSLRRAGAGVAAASGAATRPRSVASLASSCNRAGGKKLAFGPGFFFQKDREKTSLLVGPYAYFDRSGPEGRTTTHALLPIALFHRAPGRSAQVIFPLFLQAREDQTTVRSVALLYWGLTVVFTFFQSRLEKRIGRGYDRAHVARAMQAQEPH